ncbi:MAG: endonuclease [Deltaproteobacteria bacterium HGW-Deltaproteobacteria-13]|jgi:putative endonuclease|nr:MAG: endonuclease [Deltaproteobacteria bacterium HGW-Deltaproteobacteria-13]
MKKSDKIEWLVYVLKCRNNYLYTGITNNLEKRLKEHKEGKGSKFVRAWRPFELVKTLPCSTSTEARQLEYRLKKMKRAKKLEVLDIKVEDIKKK